MAKIKILSVTVNASKVEPGMPIQYTVGQAPVEGAAVVERIVHYSENYNKGNQGNFPCYTVYLADGVRRIIAIDMAGMVDVAKIDEAETVAETTAVADVGGEV